MKRQMKLLLAGVPVGLALVAVAVVALGGEGRGVPTGQPTEVRNPEATDIDVRIRGGALEPPVTRIRSGQIVRWRNEDARTVRVEAVGRERGLAGQGLGSRPLARGATHAFRAIRPGRYRYRLMIGRPGSAAAEPTADTGPAGSIEAR